MLSRFCSSRPAAALLLGSTSVLCRGESASRPADSDVRPVCKREIQGRMWPDAANHDRKLIASLLRCGELSICVRGTWHYHCEPASVTVAQLSKHFKSKPAKRSGGEVFLVAENHAAPAELPNSGGN